MSRATLISGAIAIGALARSLGACAGPCPDGQTWLYDPWEEDGGHCAPPQTSAPECFGLGCADPRSVNDDAGLVDEDAGACAAASADDICVLCAKAACCDALLACSTGDGGFCSPSDPAGVPLASCISSSCAAQCPGVP